eukprot:GFUD01076966.1.p1 GENE.GFUD01076966.1~~GFUD01076966.1.p1  ORF type:complete len:123 (-),score=26.06 GFUD01076966.1:42-410(-)
MVANMKLALIVLVSAVVSSSASPSPLRLRRAPQNGETSNRFFSGNSAIDAGAAGAALGAAAQFFGNQVFNPCRGGTRGGNGDSNTNTRFLGGQTLQNAGLGFLAGFAGSSLINNALGNPCGK